jgi:hypothetical protein
MNILNTWEIRCFSDRDLRKKVEDARKSLVKEIGAGNKQLGSFYDKIDGVVRSFNHEHLTFGDKYFRLKLEEYKPIVLSEDFLWNCRLLKNEHRWYAKPRDAWQLADDAETYYKYVLAHNHGTLIRFLGYDSNMRTLLRTIEDVHLRGLAAYANDGQVGGSPIGVNPIIADMNNTRGDYLLRQPQFDRLAKDLDKQKLSRPV